MPAGTSPPSHPPERQNFSTALLAVSCSPAALAARPAAIPSLAEHREEKEISPPHCKLAAGQSSITPWDCNYILLAQASWEARPLPANYRTLYCH